MREKILSRTLQENHSSNANAGPDYGMHNTGTPHAYGYALARGARSHVAEEVGGHFDRRVAVLQGLHLLA